MTSLEESALALELILDSFGPVVKNVATILHQKGKITMAEVVRYSSLPRPQVRQALQVLVAQNLAYVSAEERESAQFRTDENGTKVPVINTLHRYIFFPRHAIYRLSFPKFIAIADKLLGDRAMYLIEQLCECGKLDTDTAVRNAVARYYQKNGSGDKTPDANDIMDFRNSFTELVQGSYVVTSSLTTPMEEDRERPEDEGELKSDEEDATPAPSAGRGRGAKRKAGAVIIKAAKKSRGVLGAIPRAVNVELEESALYRVNYTRFLCQLRYERVVDYIRDKVSARAAAAVRVLLSIASKANTSIVARSIGPITTKNIMDISGTEFNHQELTSLFGEIQKDHGKLMTMEGGGYILQIGRIIDILQTKSLESIVENKYGVISARVFRLLVEKKLLEQKQITHMVLVQERESREHLYRLFHAGFVRVQEVSKNNNHKIGDQMTSTFYLWGADLDNGKKMIQKEILTTARRLQQRLRHEQDQHDSVLANKVLGVNPEQTHKFNTRINRLDHAIMQLIQNLFLYHF